MRVAQRLLASKREVIVSLVERALRSCGRAERARKRAAAPPVVAKVVNAAAPAFVARGAKPELPPYNPNKLVKVDRDALAARVCCRPRTRSAS